MKVFRSLFNAALLALVLASAPALAKKPKPLTLGVFLPTAMADGQERFALGEALAKELSGRLGTPVVAKNFGRYEDFLAEAKRNRLDLAIVDGWVGVEVRQLSPFGLATRKAGTHERWAVVSRGRTLVKDLAGQNLAVPRGAKGAEARFISNVLFEGDFSSKRFKLVYAPNIESVLKLLETKKAAAAIVPVSQVPEDLHVAYRSTLIPHVLMLGAKGLSAEVLDATVKVGGLGPFTGFKRIDEKDVGGFSRLLARGPPSRQPMMTPSPIPPLDTTRILELGDVGFVLPSFTEYVEISAELPDP